MLVPGSVCRWWGAVCADVVRQCVRMAGVGSGRALLLCACTLLPLFLMLCPTIPFGCRVSLPPVPASQPQPSSQLANQPPNQESTVPQAASGAKKGWDFNPPLWQIKLVTIGALLLFAAFSFQQGNVTSACLDLLVAVVLMLPPWSDSV